MTVTGGGGYPQPTQPLSPQQQLLLQQQAHEQQQQQAQEQQTQQVMAAQAASQMDAERIQTENNTIGPSPTGVRIYNPRTGRAEVGLYNVQEQRWVPASSVTYEQLQHGIIGTTNAVIMRPVPRSSSPASEQRAPATQPSQPVEEPWEKPFKARGITPVGIERTAAIDTSGSGRMAASEKIIYGDAWVLPWDTKYVVEPGNTNYEKAVTQHGEPLSSGGYDPQRGVYVISASSSGGPLSGTLGDLFKDKIGGQQFMESGGHTLEELWSRRAAAPAPAAAPETAARSAPVDLSRIFTDKNSLFYFDAGHGTAQIDWAGQRVTVDTLTKGMFEHGASVMGGANAIANAMPPGIVGSAAGAVVETAASVYATPFMAIGAGGMLMEIAGQHPGTVGQVLVGTPGFMVQSHMQGYAENPTRAGIEDLLMLGIIAYGGARAAGVKPMDIARAGKFREFGEYLYSDTSAQLGGRVAPRTQTVLMERPASAPVREINLQRGRYAVVGDRLVERVSHQPVSEGPGAGRLNYIAMRESLKASSQYRALFEDVDAWTSEALNRAPEPTSRSYAGPRTGSGLDLGRLNLLAQSQENPELLRGLMGQYNLSSLLGRQDTRTNTLETLLGGQATVQEQRQDVYTSLLSSYQQPRSLVQSPRQNLFTPRAMVEQPFIDMPQPTIERPRGGKQRPLIDVGDLLEPPRRRKKGSGFSRVWINPAPISGAGHAPVTIKKPGGLTL